MSDNQHPEINPDETTTYQIRIKGHLANDWEDWFDNVSITQVNDGETLLTCTIQDQSALHGLLRRIRDLGLPLISVVQTEPDGSDE